MLGSHDAQAQSLSINRYMYFATFELKTNYNFTII